jgi:hypothetical protein
MFTGLQADEISKFWDELVVLLDKPLKKTNARKHYSPEDALYKCMDRDWQCWVAFTTEIDCVFITYIETYPTGHKNLVIYLVGGSKIDSWLQEAWETFKDYANFHQCKQIVGMGRKGWLKMLKKVEDNDFEEHLTFSVEV